MNYKMDSKKFQDKETEESTSEVWNISKSYVYEKILKPMIDIDKYDKIAVFGTTDLEGDLFLSNMKNNILRNTSRLKAFRMEFYTMRVLIRNSKFIVKKNNIETFENYSARLLKMEKSIPHLRLEKTKGRKLVELNIDEALFDKMHAEVEDKINEINSKLNEVGIIFALGEEKDVEKIKDSYNKRFLSRT